MLTFEDLENKITAALGILLLSWGGYITSQVIESPSKNDVEKMINRSQEDAHKSIQDIYLTLNKLNAENDRLRDTLVANNDKLWAEISLLRIEMEKMKMKVEYSEQQKKN